MDFYTRDWSDIEPRVACGVLRDIAKHADFIAAEKLGKNGLMLKFRGGGEFRVEGLKPSTLRTLLKKHPLN